MLEDRQAVTLVEERLWGAPGKLRVLERSVSGLEVVPGVELSRHVSSCT